MEITIKRATKEDCPRLLELVQELATYERAPNEVTVTLEHFAESGFGEKPVWWGFVALTPDPSPSRKAGERGKTPKEKIVGFALYYIRYSTWKGQAMYLEDIIITNEMRGKGIGKLLFDRLIEEARERKFNRIIWQVLDWNEPAIKFYKKYNADFDQGWVNCSIYV
jgi:ribosomal protein S18 acetylase RimI-like enzyme